MYTALIIKAKFLCTIEIFYSVFGWLVEANHQKAVTVVFLLRSSSFRSFRSNADLFHRHVKQPIQFFFFLTPFEHSLKGLLVLGDKKKEKSNCFVLCFKCEACPQFSGNKETRLMQFVHFHNSTSLHGPQGGINFRYMTNLLIKLQRSVFGGEKKKRNMNWAGGRRNNFKHADKCLLGCAVELQASPGLLQLWHLENIF